MLQFKLFGFQITVQPFFWILTGLLGMNVEGIPYAEQPWAFWAIVGFCVLIGATVLGYFIRVRWVQGR